MAGFFDNNLPDGNVNSPAPGPWLPELEADVPVADLQLPRLETAMVVKAANRNALSKLPSVQVPVTLTYMFVLVVNRQLQPMIVVLINRVITKRVQSRQK